MSRVRGAARHVTVPETAQVVDLDHEGRGVARIDGKAIFIADALPGDEVELLRTKRRDNFDEAVLQKVLVASPDRVGPRCPHFGVCGGCALQHLSASSQLAYKQRQLREALERIGKVTPGRWLEPLQSDVWNYRRRARLGARWVAKKNKVVVGFRERSSALLTDTRSCDVLPQHVSKLLVPLSELLTALSIRDRVPQVEVSVGEGGTVFVVRVLDTPSEADLQRLRTFGAEHEIHMYLQPGGHGSIVPLAAFGANAGAIPKPAGDPDSGRGESAGDLAPVTSSIDSMTEVNGMPAVDSNIAVDVGGALGLSDGLSYTLPEFDVELDFKPNDFVQVHAGLNRLMIGHALELLEPQPGDRVLDLFCGLGNFSLPMARRCGEVVGVEAETSLVQRAAGNAERNGIGNARFVAASLFQDPGDAAWARQPYQRVLIDPPRAGAREILPFIARSDALRVVYISCHPGSLARDAGILVHELGFTLTAAGVMDMFPHTTHIESVAVFDRGRPRQSPNPSPNKLPSKS